MIIIPSYLLMVVVLVGAALGPKCPRAKNFWLVIYLFNFNWWSIGGAVLRSRYFF